MKTVRDYEKAPLTDYEKKMRENSKRIYNHTPTKHAQKTIDHIKLVPDGGKYTDLPPELAKNFNYKYNRIPSVRENARLQSFPDDFVFYGNKQQQYKQVGNAVPPLLGYALANKIKEYLDEGVGLDEKD